MLAYTGTIQAARRGRRAIGVQAWAWDAEPQVAARPAAPQEPQPPALPAQVADLLGLLAEHDAHTAAHGRRVAALALRIGRAMGLAGQELADLYHGALLHDLGKISISPALLAQPVLRTSIEVAIVRRHPAVGAQIVRALGLRPQVAALIRAHHERWDGAGFPDGLAGAEIPLGARIIAVADAFDGLTSPGPNREPLDPAIARQLLPASGGRRWDPQVLAALERLLAA